MRSRREPGEPLWSERHAVIYACVACMNHQDVKFSMQELSCRRACSSVPSLAHHSLRAHAAPQVCLLFLLQNVDCISNSPFSPFFSGSHFTCMFGGAIRVCYSNPVHWCASSRYADYTNNPMMYSRLWLLQHLGDQFAGFQCFCCRSCIFVNIWFRRQPQHNGTADASLVATTKFYDCTR